MKRFIKGNTYVFTTKKYKKAEREKVKKGSWVSDCNGMEVSFDENNQGAVWFKGKNSPCFMDFWVHPRWCKCIKQGNKNHRK